MNVKQDNLIGTKHGKLLVLEFSHREEDSRSYYKCLCDCGNYFVTRSYRLLFNNKRGAKSCGCSRREDLTGKKFGLLTVTRFDKRVKHNDKSVYYLYWLCKCDCGNETSVIGNSLRQGITISCGCKRKENTNAYIKSITKAPGESAAHATFLGYRNGAKRRGISFDIEENLFRELCKKDCHYCGGSPSNICHRKSNTGSFVYNGLDRVDNDKGYTIDNVVACCKKCNGMKEKNSQNDFLEQIERIYKFSIENKDNKGTK